MCLNLLEKIVKESTQIPITKINTEEDFRQHLDKDLHYILIVPGGNAYFMGFGPLYTLSSLIQGKIDEGKWSYLGVCAGSYIACDKYILTIPCLKFSIDNPKSKRSL